MRRTAVRLLTLSLPLAACVAAAASAPAVQKPCVPARDTAGRSFGVIEAEEYAVLSVILDNWYRFHRDGSFPAGSTFLIKDKTESGYDASATWVYAEMKQSSKELLDETIEDFKAKNKQSYKFGAHFATKVCYALINAEEVDSLFEKKGPLAGWEDFNLMYPESGGYVIFSRVGFNSDKTQALVYLAHGCGSMCGEGGHLLFVKKGGVWVEKGSVGSSWIA